MALDVSSARRHPTSASTEARGDRGAPAATRPQRATGPHDALAAPGERLGQTEVRTAPSAARPERAQPPRAADELHDRLDALERTRERLVSVRADVVRALSTAEGTEPGPERGTRSLPTGQRTLPTGTDLGWTDLAVPDVWDLIAIDGEAALPPPIDKYAKGLIDTSASMTRWDPSDPDCQPPPPPDPPPPPEPPSGGGGDGGGGDPLMLDLDHDGRIGVTGASTAFGHHHRTGLGRTVLFDIDGDGKKDRVEWSDGRGDGLLVDDRDGAVTRAARGSGEISGRQLFGDEGGRFAHGYEKLARLDANRDGKLSDRELDGLKVWIDDGDAKVEDGELRTLGELGITDISARMQLTPNAAGEALMRSTFTQHGQTHMSEDVWFGIGAARGEPAAAYRSLLGELDVQIAEVNREALRLLDRISADADADREPGRGRPSPLARMGLSRRI